MRHFLIGLALLAMTCAFAETVTMPVNLKVLPYAYAGLAANTSGVAGWNHDLWGANPANDGKTAFNLEVDGNGGSGQDTVNIAIASNIYTQYQFAFTPGNLPGTWTMELDGAGVTGMNQLFQTDPCDIGVNIVAPLKVMCAGVNINTAAGNYSGSLMFTTIPE
jgi:hypothetical protein